jgi:hypothetical protein
MKRDQRFKNREQRHHEGLFSKIVTFVIIVGMLATLGVLVWHNSTTPVDTSDYDGIIVDRWADYAESREGSQTRLRLVVESQGKRFTVKVDPNVYDSAKVGMRIKSRSGQVVLIDSSASNK